MEANRGFLVSLINLQTVCITLDRPIQVIIDGFTLFLPLCKFPALTDHFCMLTKELFDAGRITVTLIS